MTLVVVGLSHRQVTAEALARVQEVLLPRLPAWLAEAGGIEGAVVLATCNRLELYLEAHGYHRTVAAVTGLLDDHGLAELTPLLDSASAGNAVRHLFEVTSGLDSVVLGEAEITGQVRSALAASNRLTPKLRRLFDAALVASKVVANSTPLGRRGNSIAQAGLDLAEARSGRGERATVLGTGSFAKAVVGALVERGYRVTQVSLSGRTVRALHPGVHWTDRLDLADSELLVTCRGGDRLTPDTLHGAGLPEALTVLDLALGGDLDPAARSLPGVRYLNLDDLIADAGSDRTGLAEARAVVEDAVESFLEAERGRAAAPEVGAIRGHVERIVAAEIDRATRNLDPTAAETVARSLRRVAGALLHTPSVRAAEHARRGELDHYRHALHTVFGPDLSA